MDTYLLLKTIHIVSATLLFGTGLGSAYYMWFAHRSQDVRVIAHTASRVVIADWLFTTPSIIIQPLTGFWMMSLNGIDLSSLWIISSLVLYVVAGLCWLPVVWIQIRVRELSKQAITSDTLHSDYYRYMKVWFSLGWPAFISLVIIFFLMVLKPV